MQEFKIGSSQQSQLSHIQAYNLKPYGKTEAVFIKKPIVGSDEIKYNHPGLKNLIKQYTIPTQVAILSDLYKFLVLGKKPTSDNFEGRMKLEELEDLTPENIAQFFAIHMSFTNTTTHKHDTDELYRDHFIKHELYLLPELYKTVRTTLTAPEHTKRANHLLDKLVEKLNSDIDTQVNSKISTERERASNDVSSLKRELTQSKEYISQLEEKINELRQSHERKSGEFEIARNKLEEITISRKNSGEELERTEKKINIARSRIEDLADRELKDPSFKEELINAKEEYNTLVSRYEELSSNFHELEREYNTANRNVSEREREISRIKLELLSITRNKDEAERDVLDLRQAIESEAVKHRKEIVDLEEKYLKTALESVFKAEMPLKTRVLELEESNQTMVKEINRLAEIEKQYNQMILAQSQFKAPVEVLEKAADLI